MSLLKAPLLATALLGLLTAGAAFAAEAPAAAPFTDAQKAAIESMIRELLVDKEPEIVMKAAQNLQEKMEKADAAKGEAALTQHKDKIFKDANAPVGGNPKGDVTMVEFFDYSCGYCKMAQATLKKFVTDDKNIRLIYKEFPILGPQSVFMAKAALASVAQGKYLTFHDAMMESKERLTEDAVKKLAKDVGIDVERMLKDMESEKIAAMIKANQELAGELGIRGTPGFVIGDKLYPGALSAEQLKDVVEKIRKGGKK